MTDRHRPSMRSAASVVAAIASPDAAAVFGVLATDRPDPPFADMSALAATCGFGAGPGAIERLDRAEDGFLRAFGIRMLDVATLRTGSPDGAKDGWLDTTRGQMGVAVSPHLVRVLGSDLSPVVAAAAPVPDATTRKWVATIAAAARTRRGSHFALRCAPDDRKDAADFAAMLAASLGGDVHPIEVHVAEAPLAEILLRSELHAGARPPIVVVAVDRLFERGPASEAWFDPGDQSTSEAAPAGWLDLSDRAVAALGAFSGVHCTYVWRIPADGALPRTLDGIVGGVVGPIGYDRDWSEGVVARSAPRLGPRGVSAVLSALADPRRAGAMASASAAASAGVGVDPDAAAAFVASSFGSRPGGTTAVTPPTRFDARLFVAPGDPDIGRRLLERADHLARNGARVLLHGAPGGGKSTFGVELSRRMAHAMGRGDAVVTISPARILRKPWGATERLLENLWAGAAADGAVVWIDELDALCGARDPAETGGNGHLVRCLTDQFLRDLDAHPDVPLVAACNSVAAIDPAVRRRFVFEIAVGDDLPPDRERLAWDLILGRPPPRAWRAVGASVSDMTIAAARCRMLGLDDAASLADAIVRARTARRGGIGKPAGRSSVH